MKIVENTKETNPITFSDIKVGDVFKLKGDKNYYMKTQHLGFEAYDFYYDTSYYDSRNTVCLSNGKIMRTSTTTEVIPVDCELIIK